MWIDPDTQTVYRTRAEIRAAHPHTSFPEGLPNSTIAGMGLLPVTEVAAPAYNRATHTLAEGAPALVGGTWTQQWVLTALAGPDATQALQRARRARWRDVKALRDDKIQNGGILTNAQWYPSSAAAKAQILWVKAVGANTGERIELLDGSMANLTFARANDLLAAGATQSAAIAAHADALKTQIDASADPDSIDITAGWPATYVPT